MKYRTTPWFRNIETKTYPRLEEDMEVDALVIGGGITGLLTAYFLEKRGLSVAIVEKEKLFSGATGATTAFLTHSIDTNTTKLGKMIGEEDTRLVLESHKEAIATVENIIKKESIDCDFKRCSNFIYANSKKEFELLENEHQALTAFGFENRLSHTGDLGFRAHGFLELPKQAKFHPLKFAQALANILEERGVKIFEHSEVKEVESKKYKRISKTKQGSVTSKWVVSATYEPFGEPLSLIFKKGMYKSYVLELEVEKGALKEAIYEDVYNPYHYFRVDSLGEDPKHDRIIIGGEDNKIIIPVKEQTQFEVLEEYVKEIFPTLKYEVVYKWSGPILESSDGLAFIGPSHDEQIMYAMAFSGNGMTYSAIAATIIADLVSHKENRFYHVYRTNRWMGLKSLSFKFKDYADEMIRGAMKNIISPKKKKK